MPVKSIWNQKKKKKVMSPRAAKARFKLRDLGLLPDLPWYSVSYDSPAEA